MTTSQIEVQILDRSYTLSVSEAEQASLLEAVRRVDERMRALRDGGRLVNPERIAVMAALQFAHDLIEQQSSGTPNAPSADVQKRLRHLTERLDEAISRQESLF